MCVQLEAYPRPVEHDGEHQMSREAEEPSGDYSVENHRSPLEGYSNYTKQYFRVQTQSRSHADV